MERFTKVTGVAAPLLMTNINTDLIAPSLMPGRTPEEASQLTLKDKLFANLRYYSDGREKPDFPLSHPRYHGAQILLAGPNFGCGSSRETAVWSLMEAGVRCVIAPSFGDIFHDNAFQNGLLPLRLEMAEIERIAEALERSNTSTMTVDLQRCVLEVPGISAIAFNLAEDRRLALLEGVDQLSVIMRSVAEIEVFEQRATQEQPWLYLARCHQ
jgi:3-isopropylmalate/(R)-2-methylmalate dehydratase small subunit